MLAGAWPARRALTRLAADRRGVTALVFAAVATVLIGVVALGTDAGYWYSQEHRAQAAADASALAAALALGEGNDQTVALGSAAGIAQQNGYATTGTVSISSGSATLSDGTTSVAIHNPPSSGSHTGDTKAVEVIIRTAQTKFLSGLFLAGTPFVTVRAVADVVSVGPVCAVAIGNVSSALLLGGHTTITGANCALASNSTANPAIEINGNPSVSASALVTVGSCSGCTGAGLPPWIQTPIPVGNPFAAADTTPLPIFSNCQTPNLSATLAPYDQATNNVAYCGFNLDNGSKTAVTLVPGTYFFTSSIDLEGGSVVCPTCTGSQGVTIVLTHAGSSANAGLTINGNFSNSSATVTLRAPVQNTTSYNGNTLSGLNGVLLYEDPTGQPGGIQINGNSNSNFFGGLYFPQDSVTINGNATLNSSGSVSNCFDLVAGSIDSSGNSTTAFDVSGCAAAYGQNMAAEILAARVVE